MANMKQDDVLKRWITELSDEDLMDAFDQCLAKDEVALMWFLADDIQRPRLEI